MTPMFFAGAAAGALGSWIYTQQHSREQGARLRGDIDSLRAEKDTAYAGRSAMEGSLAELRERLEGATARLNEATARLDEAHRELDASRAQLDGAHRDTESARKDAELARIDAEAQRRTAEILRSETTLRAKEEVRAEVEREARARAAQIVADARQQTVEMQSEVRAKLAEHSVREQGLVRRELLSAQKDDTLTQRDNELSRRDRALGEKEKTVGERDAQSVKLEEARKVAVEEARKSEHTALERVAQLSSEDAKKEVIDLILDDARRHAAREARQIEEIARDESEKRAKRVIGIAVQRYAGEYAGERAVTTVHLPSDELKGRIIGREGRNIRTFQEVTGCDLVIDDTPETIVVSSFDPVRREMARLTLERLIQDGRIHPTKIEEFFNKSKDEVERTIRDSADQAVMELGIGRLHPDLMKILGQLRYRYSYAQNVLRHSIEVGHMCGLMATEMGVNVKLARRAGLLHDIGKAVTHETEGGHAVVGGQMARKAGEDEMVVNAIAAHHDDEPAKGILAHLTAAADAISGARPGARREMLESYVRRLEDIEKICTGFKGVEKSFAIQAGREVRVLVEPSEVDDAGALALSRDIARKIESEMAYPGQIRVTVVRETRAVDYAR